MNFNKNFQIFTILFLLSFQIFGQDNFPLLRTNIDGIFANIDKTPLTYGILEENSFGFMNLSQVNTENIMPKDSLHYINSLVWRMTYATLQTGRINNNYSLPIIDSINRRIEKYRFANPTHNPIMLLRANYHSIDTNLSI